MRTWLESVLDQLLAGCRTPAGVPIPVFIHGYDFPVPDARWLGGVSAPTRAWLYPSFNAKGYESNPGQYPANGTPIMQALITRLNQMQIALAALPKFQNRVFHVNLTGTLSSQPAAYKADWDNELHPSVPGFTALTQRFAAALAAAVPALQPRP